MRHTHWFWFHSCVKPTENLSFHPSVSDNVNQTETGNTAGKLGDKKCSLKQLKNPRGRLDPLSMEGVCSTATNVSCMSFPELVWSSVQALRLRNPLLNSLLMGALPRLAQLGKSSATAQQPPPGMQCGNTSEVLQIMFELEESVHNTSQDMESKNKACFLVNAFLPLKQKLLSSY